MRRQLYGGREADEFRSSGEAFADRLRDNEIAEGEHVTVLRRMASERAWDQLTCYVEKLREQGHSQARVDSMVARSTTGLRF